MKKIRISPLSIIWLVFLIYSKTPFLVPMICAIAVHELGHVICARILKLKLRSFELSMLGARIEAENVLSYGDEMMLALGGPLFGFIGAAIAIYPAIKNSELPFFRDFLLPFAIISLCLTVFNLIPLTTLDGGRILKCLLCKMFPLYLADKILKITSFFTLFSLWLFSVYMMLKTAEGLPMFVFSAIFFSKCFIFDVQNKDLKSF